MFVYKSDKKELSKDSIVSKQSKSSNRMNPFHNEHFYPVSAETARDYYAVSSTTETPVLNKCSIVQRYLIVGNKDKTSEYYRLKRGAPNEAEENLDRFVTGVVKEMIEEIDTKIDDEITKFINLESCIENDPESLIREQLKKLHEITELINLKSCIKNDPENLIRKQLKKWIQDDVGNTANSKNKTFGQKFQPRAYSNYCDLAVALIGWVNAKQNRRLEKVTAQIVMKDKAVNFHLDSVFIKIKNYIDNSSYKKEFKREIQNPDQKIISHHEEGEVYNPKPWAIYKSYFDSKSKEEMKLPAHWAVLKDPDSHTIRQKTGVLHDLMHYFLEKFGDTFLLAELPKFQATTLKGRENYERPQNSQIWGNREAAKAGGTPLNLSRVKYSNEEQHNSYKYARRNNLPMYGRHSYSAARMMGLAKQAGATKEEISAVSWAIMAYWRIHYDHTSIPYHTAHEIMDFTPAFDLEYHPEEHLAGFSAIQNDNFLKFLLEQAHSNGRAAQALLSFYDSKFERAKFLLQHEDLWDIPDIMNYLRRTKLPFDQFQELPASGLIAFFKSQKGLLKLLSKRRQRYIQSIMNAQK